jgi:DNA-binding response OmpR family regulator
VILIVSSLAREAEALAALCEQRRWPVEICRTVARLRRTMEKITPKLVIIRQRLSDGYSDDLLTMLSAESANGKPRVIVLAPADCSINEETRQLSLGADSVLRDPIRIQVLLELAARYRSKPAQSASQAGRKDLAFEFAGARIFPHECRLARDGKNVRTTPRVIQLVQVLHRMTGQVASYDSLYPELFDRRFAGDTANCRVLLAKADMTFRRLGVNLRRYIKVIPKSGYLYSGTAPLPKSDSKK